MAFTRPDLRHKRTRRHSAAVVAYYNEFDRQAAAWLRELIKDGLIAPGDVDERSIEDVQPDDLRGYDQCHFFAGIGVWSYALRLVGVPDDVPIWTGSCPCQPLSIAGQQRGHEDERHLWPAFYRLIRECRPPTVFGEQVDSRLGLEWIAGVQADLEDAGYAVGAASLNSAGVGAPHIRQRLYWVADTDHTRPQGRNRSELQERAGECLVGPNGASGGLGDAQSLNGRIPVQRRQEGVELGGPSEVGRLASAYCYSSYWHLCTDGLYRRVPLEPSFQFVATGLAAVLGDEWTSRTKKTEERLTRYGNSHQADTGQVLRAMWMLAHSEDYQRADGGPSAVHETSLLLPALCQLARSMGHIPEVLFEGSASESSDLLRTMRSRSAKSQTTSHSSSEWRLDRQSARELRDALYELSHEASQCHSAREIAMQLSCFPLAPRTAGHVGLLRGAGNAITAQVAATFIKASLEAIEETSRK